MRYLAAITMLVLAITLAQPVVAQNFKPNYQAGRAAKDWATTLRHFRPLAKQGYAEAQYMLGEMHNNGDGVTKDYKEAVKWYRKAANQGHAWAQNWLGEMYHDGHGVVQDLVMAYVWVNLAIANGMKYAEMARDNALARLNASERKLGRKLSKLCFKKPAKCPEYSY